MLDIGTAYIVTACALIGLALLQTGALATRLFSPWLGWWAASNLLQGGGTLLIGLQTQLPFWLSVHTANTLVWLPDPAGEHSQLRGQTCSLAMDGACQYGFLGSADLSFP
jgi:hypothetical protein